MKVKILKEYKAGKVGDIIDTKFPAGDEQEYVDNGYIEILEYDEPKKKNFIPEQLRDMKFCKIRFKTKVPYENGWQKEGYSYDEISQTIQEGRDNYGVLTGVNGLGVLDDDSENKILMKTFEDKFGESFRVRDHYYIKLSGWDGKKIIFFDGDKHLGELQGLGQQVVGANSVHPSGEVYDVRKDIKIKTIPFNEFQEAFKNFIKSSENSIKAVKKNVEDDDFIKSIKENWNEGNRQDLAMSVAGYLRKEKRLGLDSALSIVENICKDCNDEELNSRLRAVQETYKKDESKIKGISGLVERNVKVDETPIEIFLKQKGFNKKTGRMEYSVNIDKVADFIIEDFNIRTIYGIKEETLEVYKEGVWTTKGKGIIKAQIEKLLKNYSKNNVVAEILEKVKRKTETDRETADDVPDYKRAVENGVLDLENINNIKFIPHSKDFNFRHKFPMEYNPKAECPNFLNFVKEIFYPEDILGFQEWLGLHLIRRYLFKKSALLHGPKNTGKSVVLNFLTKFIGGNASGLSIQEISREKAFDLIAMKDKDANIHDDLSSYDMKCVGGFKKAVGDGFIDGEFKFGDKCKFKNTAKNTNACNKIPSPGEDLDDDAYYERFLLFPIDNVVASADMDRNLLDKITTPAELSGVLNWAIEGYKRLMKNNKFSNEKSPEETKFVMVQNGNSLAKFAHEVLIEQNGSKVTKEEMYKFYCDWCRNHKPQLSPDTKEKLGRNLTKVAPFTQASSNGKERYWVNVKINDTYYTSQNNMRIYFDSKKNDSKNNRYVNSESVISVSKDIKHCPKCNAPMIENKCIGGCE